MEKKRFQKMYHSLLVLAIITVLGFPTLSFSQRAIDPELQRQIDNFIQDVFLPAAQITGLGLAIVRDDGELLYTTGYGLADQEKGIPNGNETQFLIGSVTKSFTSTVVAKVLSEKFPELGETVLDTPIRKLVPQANFTLVDRFRSEQATFRDLLAHRMCLFRDDLQLFADPFDTPADIVYRERYAPQICGVRTEYQYNNQMYVVAAELAGILANRPFEDLMDDLLSEIGMSNSAFVKSTDDFSNMPHRSQPYYIRNNVIHPINPELVKRIKISNPAGGLFVPPDDMVRYIRFRLNMGSIDGKQVVPENVMTWLTKPAIMVPGFAYKSQDSDLIINTFAYALGLGLASYDGYQYVTHDGYYTPYLSMLSFFPTQKLGIFTSTNQGPMQAGAVALHAFIFEVLRGAENANATEKVLKVMEKYQAKAEEDKRSKESHLENFLKQKKSFGKVQNPVDILGEYGSGMAGQVEIFEKVNEETNTTGVYLSYGRWSKGWVEGFGDDAFIVSWDTDMVQDDYAVGNPVSEMYLTVYDGTLEFFTALPEGMLSRGTFQLGVSLANLPPIPWSPESCGPESKKSHAYSNHLMTI